MGDIFIRALGSIFLENIPLLRLSVTKLMRTMHNYRVHDVNHTNKTPLGWDISLVGVGGVSGVLLSFKMTGGIKLVLGRVNEWV